VSRGVPMGQACPGPESYQFSLPPCRADRGCTRGDGHAISSAYQGGSTRETRKPGEQLPGSLSSWFPAFHNGLTGHPASEEMPPPRTAHPCLSKASRSSSGRGSSGRRVVVRSRCPARKSEPQVNLRLGGRRYSQPWIMASVRRAGWPRQTILPALTTAAAGMPRTLNSRLSSPSSFATG